MYSLTKGAGGVFEMGVDGFSGIAIGTAPSRYAADTGRRRGMRSEVSPLRFNISHYSCVSWQNRTESRSRGR